MPASVTQGTRLAISEEAGICSATSASGPPIDATTMPANSNGERPGTPRTPGPTASPVPAPSGAGDIAISGRV